jgi:hypothetical protein
MGIRISITSHNNNDPMGQSVSGDVQSVVFMPPPRSAEPEPDPAPNSFNLAVPSVMVIFQRTDVLGVGIPVPATVTGDASPWLWSANEPSLPNGTYTIVAIAFLNSPLPTSDSRSGIHKP